MDCRNPSCKVGVIRQGQFGAEGDAPFAARLASGFCSPRCRRLAGPFPKDRPIPPLSPVSWHTERTEGVAVPKEKTPRSEPYKAFIREQQCLLAGVKFGLCEGDVIPHHTGSGGMSIKGSDLSCVPLCCAHHLVMDNAGKKGRGVWTQRELDTIITRLNEEFNRIQADKRRKWDAVGRRPCNW